MHYDNLDNSGVRFYLKKELRQYEFGYLTLGVDKTPFAIAIPPKADRFIFDSYYPAEPTQGRRRAMNWLLDVFIVQQTKLI
ncbi:unnamed protein product [Rotaria sp. Silwood1]|nr:unnamed protein product [Rotaria sp. Silwood1]